MLNYMINSNVLQIWEKPTITFVETKHTADLCAGKAFSNDDAEVGSTCSAS